MYKIPGLPVFEGNLRNLARKIRTTCALAHVRGVAYRETEVVSQENLHPFLFDGCRLAMAHNGELADFAEMKYALLEHIRPELAQKIVGTTDSAWIYAVLMSQFADPAADHDATEIRRAVEKTLRALRKVREQIGIRTSSSVNLFLCDGNDLVATRFSFDFGCYGDNVQPSDIRYLSLWYTFGREYGLHDGEWKMRGGHENADSVIVASEPRRGTSLLGSSFPNTRFSSFRGPTARLASTPLRSTSSSTRLRTSGIPMKGACVPRPSFGRPVELRAAPPRRAPSTPHR